MPVDPIMKSILENQKYLISLQKENKDIKKTIKILERKIDIIIDKIQDFEVVLDAAEILEERIAAEEIDYGQEWDPYDDEDFNSEQYENYDVDDDINNGY